MQNVSRLQIAAFFSDSLNFWLKENSSNLITLVSN